MRPHPDFPMAHPGALIGEDIATLGWSKTDAAKRLGITRKMLYDILADRSAITAAMALRLEKVLGSSAEFWLRLQGNYGLHVARKAAAKPAARKPATRKGKAA